MKPFWRTKSLDEMTHAEFESICDGCARCCLLKLEDETSGQVVYTDIACRLLDVRACRCTDYAHRRRRVRDCLKITPKRAESLTWLPPTCGYRLIAEGKPLAWWHPLVSGDPETVHAAGVSVRGKIFAREREVPKIVYPLRVVQWPGERPKRKPKRGRRRARAK
jgi:uncharacterized cysteine cluster protein YcgN (CxxCxxCC family)